MRCLLLVAGAMLLLCLLRTGAQSHPTAVRERMVERTFATGATGTVRVKTDGGRITVRSSAERTVTVRARERIHADTTAEADEILRDLTLTIGQEGREVTATASYRESRPFAFSGDSWPPVEVDFIVTVPAGFSAVLESGGGGTSVGDLAGSVRVHTSGGGLNLGRIGGDIAAVTSGGGAEIGEGGGAVDVASSGGSVTVQRAHGPTRLLTSGGSIRIGAVENTLQASAQGGSVHAEIAGPLQGDCLIETSGGSIDLTVDRTAGFELDAVADHGPVDADGLMLTSGPGDSRFGELAGRVNGGGPRLKLRSGDGHIEVLGR